jgi:hypothetical protein
MCHNWHYLRFDNDKAIMPIQSQVKSDNDNAAFKLELAPKQEEVVRMCAETGRGAKFIFVNGPKWTGKTIAALHAVVNHAWNTKGARICVIVPSITTGDDSGVWTLLTEQIIPEWIAGNFGFDWWTPKTGRFTAR